jgi:hypothetical protein
MMAILPDIATENLISREKVTANARQGAVKSPPSDNQVARKVKPVQDKSQSSSQQSHKQIAINHSQVGANRLCCNQATSKSLRSRKDVTAPIA